MLDDSLFSLGALEFDPKSGELRRHAHLRRLEPKASSVLGLLCLQRGEVVPRQILLDRCWGVGEGSDEALTQAVAQIRRALHDLGETDLVETLAKRGYRLRERVAPPNSVPQGSPPGAVGATSTRRLLPWLAAAAVCAFVAWLAMDPHGPLHFARHSLGLSGGHHGS